MMGGEIIILQSKDLYMEMPRFHLATGDLEVFNRDPNVKNCGRYGTVNGERVMLYRRGEKLYINVNHQEICLHNDLNMIYERVLEPTGERILFNIYKAGENVYSVTDPSFRNDPINKADFDFDEDKEEDQDFCLFMYNIANSPERQRLLYGVYSL